MRLRYSRRFESDLEAIAEYVAREGSNRAAERLVRRIRVRCQELPFQPTAYALWQVRPDLGLRRRVVGRYLVFYRVAGDVVELARVIHSARDLEGLLGDG